MTRPFWLAVGEISLETYASADAASCLVGGFDADHVYWCDPDNGRMLDVSEVLAGEWWEKNGERGITAKFVPHPYRKWLEDEIAVASDESTPEENRADYDIHLAPESW